MSDFETAQLCDVAQLLETDRLRETGQPREPARADHSAAEPAALEPTPAEPTGAEPTGAEPARGELTQTACDGLHDDVAERVRRRLAMRRRALGLDARLLEVVLGLKSGTISRLESGQARIMPAHLFRVSDLFGVSVDWFFEDSGDDGARAAAPTSAGRAPGQTGPDQTGPDQTGPDQMGRGQQGAAEVRSGDLASGEVAAGIGEGDVDEARRFLAAYQMLRDPGIREEIRELVRVLAAASEE